MKIKVSELRELEQLRQQKLELDRQSRAIAKQIGEYETLAESMLLDNDCEPVIKGGYIIRYKLAKGRVAWKEVCKDRLGETEVSLIESQAPKQNKLEIVKG